jgi:DMSO/TMAO reductase YedYZ heme-binding membrane subunit
LHYVWLAKKVLIEPWLYAGVLGLLLAIRVWALGRRWIERAS